MSIYCLSISLYLVKGTNDPPIYIGLRGGYKKLQNKKALFNMKGYNPIQNT